MHSRKDLQYLLELGLPQNELSLQQYLQAEFFPAVSSHQTPLTKSKKKKKN